MGSHSEPSPKKKQAADLAELTTESANPASSNLDQLRAIEIVRLMNREDATVAAAVAKSIDSIAAAVESIVGRLSRAGGRLIYMGAGTSGRLGVLDASECPPTFNTPPELVSGLIAGGHQALTRSIEGAEDCREDGVRDLQAIQLGERDALLGIASSGRTPYVIGGMRYAQSIGALTVGLCCNTDSELAPFAEILMPIVVGPEVVAGSTRLKAGTATKMVLNMISTASMVLMGKTFGNLMVDVRATNEKLADRAKRLVTQLTELPGEKAESLLKHCGGELKTAVVSEQLGISAKQARERLDANQGHLRRSLQQTPTFVGEPRSDLLLGVDGGGSTTVAWLADRNEHVLGKGEAGPSNLQAVGPTTALENLSRAIVMAFDRANLRPGKVTACMALAGSDRPTDQETIRDWANQSSWFDRFQIVHDAWPVLYAGTSAAAGIALISGTGSLAFGRNDSGKTARSGGWGYLFGDEGSGYAIAIAALRAAAMSADGRAKETQLLKDILAETGVTKPPQLIEVIYQQHQTPAEIAALAQLAFKAAEDGDTIASGIIRSAAADLANMVCTLADQLGLQKNLQIALSGGLLINQSRLLDWVLEELSERQIEVEASQLVPEPVIGAIKMAQRLTVTPAAEPRS